MRTPVMNKSSSSSQSHSRNAKDEATPYTPFTPFKPKSSLNGGGAMKISNSSDYYSTGMSHYSGGSTISPGQSMASTSLSLATMTQQLSAIVGSKTELVPSPDGKSIQLAPEAPNVLSPKKMLVSDSTTISPIFRNDVRKEWINAMFGPDFFPDHQGTGSATESSTAECTPPRQGVGLAGIPSYLSYAATIPPAKDAAEAGKKVGMTLSRIPVGVYVRLVDIESEAYAAGVVPGSVLIDINGMGVLGEPSHKLLERLWKFEGHFDEFTDSKGVESNKSGSSLGKENSDGKQDHHNNGQHTNHQAPIVLKLIKDGIVYSAVLMTKPPFGISWAPCGNFALIQRTYSLAQKAGVRRGCIVAAVNDKSLREMNHLDTAMYLKDQFDKGKDIRVVCVFTPAASRTGHHERNSANGSNQFQKQTKDIRSFDGVRIRKVTLSAKKKEKPTEYGVGSFFTCGTGINYQPNSTDTSMSENDVVLEVANRVAAGEIAAPTGYKQNVSFRRGENDPLSFSKLVSEYSSDTNSLQDSPKHDFVVKITDSNSTFPSIAWTDILSTWDALESLIFCLRMHMACYSEENFFEIGGVIGSAAVKGESSTKIPLHSREANSKLISSIGYKQNEYALNSYVLQIVAMLSSREVFERILTEEFVIHAQSIKSLSGQKKKEYLKTLTAGAKAKAEAICDEITKSVVDSAVVDDSLCQRFHFLLRSFSSSMVKNQADGESNFAPIKMLTSAHCQLRNNLLDRDIKNIESGISYESGKSSLDQGISSYSRESSIYGTGSRDSMAWSHDRKNEVVRKVKNKRFGKLFRNRNKKGGSKDSEPQIVIEESQEFAPSSASSNLFQESKDSASNSSPPAATVRRKISFRPHSILRKTADQNPQDHDSYQGSIMQDVPSMPTLFENMGWFLSNLDQLCGNIEKSLLKSFSQKLTEWTLKPWSASKDKALTAGTIDMRNTMHEINSMGTRADDEKKKWSPVINPVDSSEFLLSVVPEESYILPSAHFPLLLTFNSGSRTASSGVNLSPTTASEKDKVDILYRTIVKVKAIRGNEKSKRKVENEKEGFAYVVHAAVCGEIKETRRSALDPYYESTTHRWHDDHTLEFETTSSNNSPGTIALRLSSVSFDNSGKEQVALNDENGVVYYSTEVGFAHLSIRNLWKNGLSSRSSHRVNVFDFNDQEEFDQQGELIQGPKLVPERLSIELEVTTESFPLIDTETPGLQISLCKRMLLYKHDEDMRQEMLATQFIDICDDILKASGLDLKIKKYKCISVGEKKGFIEWVPGAFSLSELCKPMGSSNQNGVRNVTNTKVDQDMDTSSSGVENDTSAFIRTGGWCQFESLRSLRHSVRTVGRNGIGLSGNNPVQDFFRSHAYDPNEPYLIEKEVMDNFVKSCAGYSVITYLLGIGDRHTDNLLLHPKGYFLHCDYSFILGQDPKTYLPMRITEHMVSGMGGRDSDNFAMFLSLAGAAFVTLRRHASVRTLLSTVRSMVDLGIPDVSINQSPDAALNNMYKRFRLDLNDDEAVSFLEDNIERSITSKIWIAVDAIHSLGKRF